jgi:enamine deaminase RidA (YjgF/YER057c/UK114 family)
VKEYICQGTQTIYVSGQVSIDEGGALVGAGDLAAQTVQAMRNVGLALAAAGATFADVVKITTYVVNYAPEQRDVIGKARASFFASGKSPAR